MQLRTDTPIYARLDVRRRFVDGAAYLVQKNRTYKIDEDIDTIWTYCREGLTLRKMIRTFARSRNLSLSNGIATVTAGIGLLRVLGLIRTKFSRDRIRSPSRNQDGISSPSPRVTRQ